MLADLIMIAFTMPFIGLVVAGYALLTAALIRTLREKLVPGPASASTPAAGLSHMPGVVRSYWS
jgi:hypothetical protein